MYIPQAFNEERLEVQHGLIRRYPLGLLISAGASGPLASPMPFHLPADATPYGTLQGHLARANPHWQSFDGQDVLVVFQGPDAYVTPNWYASKDEHGKVVPTWNYTMVQVRGTVRLMDDKDWIRRQITALTNDHESPRECPWHVTDAPSDYIEAQMNAIIGLEIPIRSIEGKWKLSQNRAQPDREGVEQGFAQDGNEVMSQLVRQYGELDG
jgi:transcriptional regulator